MSDISNEIMNTSYISRHYRSPNAMRTLNKVRITTLSTTKKRDTVKIPFFLGLLSRKYQVLRRNPEIQEFQAFLER